MRIKTAIAHVLQCASALQSLIAAAPAGKTRNNIGREISDYVICGAIETAKSTR